MKRTVKESDKISWRKEGGGSFLLRKNKIIKPGQVFQASLEEIPEAFRDTVIPVDEVEVKKKTEAMKDMPVADLKYTAFHRGSGWYDVKDAAGKVINEKALKKAGAEELIKSLTE